MSSIHFAVMAATRMVADQLTDDEFVAIYFATTAEQDISSGVMGYEKITPLLTQNNGTRMHSATVEALGIIAQERLK